MLNSKMRPRTVVGYGVKMFIPRPPSYVTRSPGCLRKQSLRVGHQYAPSLKGISIPTFDIKLQEIIFAIKFVWKCKCKCKWNFRITLEYLL